MDARRRNLLGQFQKQAVEERFWASVDKTIAGCWMWTASRNRYGYGKMWDGGREVGPHRWAYERFVAPIPVGLQLDHLCRNRACVNPAHLEPVTHRENVRRGEGFSALNSRKTHCPRGHAYDEANTLIYRGRRYCRSCQAERNVRAGN